MALAAGLTILPEDTFSQGSTYTTTITCLTAAGAAEDLSSGYTAFAEIRKGPVDSGNASLLTPSVSLANGSFSITVSAANTRSTITTAGTGTERLFLEVDITNTSTGTVSTFRWPLKIERETGRAS